MNALDQLGEQLRQFAEHHVPTEATVPVFVAGPIVIVAIGLITAVLGAKLARPSLTLAFAIAGAAFGAGVGSSYDISQPLAASIAAVVMGLAGFFLHRLWVGVITCVLFASLATGTYGTHRLIPQIEQYPQPPPEVLAQAPETFTVPTPQAQDTHLNPQFKTWAKAFWTDANQRDKSLTRDLVLAGATAGVLGLLLGLVAVRMTLILVTSLIGTTLLISGGTALVHEYQPDFYQACVANPSVAGIMGGVCLLASMILQLLLTRSEKSRRESKQA